MLPWEIKLAGGKKKNRKDWKRLPKNKTKQTGGKKKKRKAWEKTPQTQHHDGNSREKSKGGFTFNANPPIPIPPETG